MAAINLANELLINHKRRKMFIVNKAQVPSAHHISHHADVTMEGQICYSYL